MDFLGGWAVSSHWAAPSMAAVEECEAFLALPIKVHVTLTFCGTQKLTLYFFIFIYIYVYITYIFLFLSPQTIPRCLRGCWVWAGMCRGSGYVCDHAVQGEPWGQGAQPGGFGGFRAAGRVLLAWLGTWIGLNCGKTWEGRVAGCVPEVLGCELNFSLM